MRLRVSASAVVSALLVLTLGVAPPGRATASPPRAASHTAAVQPNVAVPAGQYVPLDVPARQVDTASVPAKATVTYNLAGRNGIPATGVVAVSAHVAVGSPTATGSLRAWAAGEPSPAVSTVLFTAGTPWTSAHTIIRLAANGGASFFNNSNGTLRLLVYLSGYYVNQPQPDGLRYVPLAQSRVADTTLAANATVDLALQGKGGLPAAPSIGAVALQVTAVEPAASGTWRLYPKGTTPRYGQGHFNPGENKTNSAITQLSSDGVLTLQNASGGAARYLVEIVGYYPSASSTVATSRVIPVPPQRILDTAAGVGATGPVRSGTAVAVPVTGRGGVPATGVSAVALMLAAHDSSARGVLTTYPTGATRPTASDLQYPANSSTGNLVWARVAADGKANIYNAGGAPQLWGDVVGYALAATPPDPPTGVHASAGNATASVSWVAPPFDGGAKITGYTVTASPGGATATTTGTSAMVSGLTNGTSYTFTVTATNAGGRSTASAPSEEVIPAAPQPPGQVFVTQVFPRDSAVRVSWSAPTTGATSVTGYTVVATPGGRTVRVGPDTRETIVDGLTNDGPYTFTVSAQNAVGSGQPSPPSAEAVPAPARVPLAPPGVSAIPLDGRINVQWSPPTDGGAAITGYRVAVTPGGQSATTGPDTTVAAVTGLTNGTAYTVTVTATNKAGTSGPATLTGIIPAAARAPAAPTDVVAIAGGTDGAVDLSWRAPADVGTGPITGYTITTDPVTTTRTVTTTSTTVSGLSATTPYTFVIRARNAAGTGAPTQPTNPIRPRVMFVKQPVVLGDTELATLQSRRGDGTLVFDQPPAAVAALKVGDIIATSANHVVPDGLLVAVTAVDTRGGLFVVSTRPARLDEMVSQADFSFTDLADLSGAAFQPASPGVSLSRPTVAGNTATGQPGRASTQGLTIHGDGSIELKAEFPDAEEAPKPKAGFGWGVELTGSIRPRITSGMEGTTLTGTVSASLDFSGRLELGMYRKTKDYFPLGRVTLGGIPLPIKTAGNKLLLTLNPVIEVGLQGETEVSAGIVASVSYSHEVGMSFRQPFRSAAQVTVINRPGRVNANQGVGTPFGRLSYKLSMPMAAKLLLDNFDDLIVAQVEVAPYVSLVADTSADHWLTIKVGVTSTATLSLYNILTANPPWKGDLVGDLVLYQWQSAGAFQGITIDPDQAQTELDTPFQFQKSEHLIGVPLTYTWEVIRGDGLPGVGLGTINQNGLYTPPKDTYTKDVIRLVGRDALGHTYESRAVIVVGHEPPDPATDVRAGPAPSSVVVGWKRATAGEPATSYLVTTIPETTPVLVDASQLHALMPAMPGQWYRVVVQAYANGMLSEPVVVGPTRAGDPLLQDGISVNVGTDMFGVPDSSQEAGRAGFVLSDNGRYVFFVTQARSNIAPPEVYNPNSSVPYLVRKDLVTGEVVLASYGLDGRTPMSVDSYAHADQVMPWAASDSGNAVVYPVSEVTPSGVFHERMYVHIFSDRETWDATAGVADTDRPFGPKISDSGDTVAFQLGDSRNDEASYRGVRRRYGGPLQTVTACPAPWQDCTFHFGYGMAMSGDANRIIYTVLAYNTNLGGHFAASFLWDNGTLRDLLPPPAPNEDDSGPPALSGDGLTYSLSYYDYDPLLAGIAVKRVGSGAIDAADLVVSRKPAGLPWLDMPWYGSQDMSDDGRLLAYVTAPDNDPDTITGHVVDTDTKRDETVAQGLQNWVAISGDGSVEAWTVPCPYGFPCPDGAGPWVRRR